MFALAEKRSLQSFKMNLPIGEITNVCSIVSARSFQGKPNDVNRLICWSGWANILLKMASAPPITKFCTMWNKMLFSVTSSPMNIKTVVLGLYSMHFDCSNDMVSINSTCNAGWDFNFSNRGSQQIWRNSDSEFFPMFTTKTDFAVQLFAFMLNRLPSSIDVNFQTKEI